jgi:hypothetical protein
MTPACETMENSFVGSACGKHGRVVVRSGTAFTPLQTLSIIPKERPFLRNSPIAVQAETSNSKLLQLQAELEAWDAASDEALVKVDEQSGRA